MNRGHQEQPSPRGNLARKGKPAPVGSPLACWKKLVFSLVVCAGFFLLAELVLALVGVTPVLYERDPYVGFSSRVPLFVRDSASQDPNTLVTARNKQRAFNLQRFSARKPKNTCRIFCLGGSTAYGHPYGDSTSFCGWLRTMLPRADPSREWELINCGGISYASYREALLMEELIAYEPDLFIILSGHNEFLEQRTYGPIIALPAALRGAGALLSKTRLYAAAKSAWSKLGSTDSAPSSPANILTADVEAILDRTIGPQSY
ncbi:MAG TPA: SGNH/GDSL hydrolase family protein, partial [Candidatus Binatia bacterium]|nr:SGNH/GDSL hydrolase family protein [Candidatus Binatia bacterium]